MIMKHFFVLSRLGGMAVIVITLAISVVLGWYITQVRFTPFIGSIELKEATLFSDSNHCRQSIPDTLLTAQVFDESLSEVLTKCINVITQSTENPPQTIQTPHEWRSDIAQSPSSSGHSGRVVYRFKYTFNSPPEGLWAIALPNVNQNVAVFLNGDLLGWGGSFEVPVARNRNTPKLFTVSNNQFKKGTNSFDVFAVSYPPDRGFLGKVYIAPLEMLLPAFQKYSFFRHTITIIITVTLSVFALFMLILWRRRPDEPEYGYLSLMIFCWFMHTVDQLVVNIPIDSIHWNGFMLVCRGFISITSILFIRRFLSLKPISFQSDKKILMVSAGLGILVLLFSEALLFQYIWSILAALGGSYVFAMILLNAINKKDKVSYALVLSGGIILTFAVHDLAVTYGLKPFYDGFYFHYGAPVFLATLSAVMMQRFVASLDETERSAAELLQLNKELESRVDERGRFIAESYEKIFELERKQALIKERARIMRDMHDGIGVYLNSILRQLSSEELDRQHLKESARYALNDLRLMIDSLGSVSGNLSAMLGMFRTRIGSALKACDITLEWSVDELPDLARFGPESTLNLLRILQEIFSNSIKHSNASSLSLSASVRESVQDSEAIIIEVRDNGKGFTLGVSKGNGLFNMSHRAKKIGVDLKINSDGLGTCTTITLPVRASDKDIIR